MYWNGLLPNADQEESVKPWRGIATETLPNDIKRQLKPHGKAPLQGDGKEEPRGTLVSYVSFWGK
jgi:hypothetical protein